MEAILYFIAGTALGVLIMAYRQWSNVRPAPPSNEGQTSSRTSKKQLMHLKTQLLQQQEDYEGHIQSLNEDRKQQFQTMLELVAELERLMHHEENNALSRGSMEALESVTEKLKEEVSGLLNLVTTFRRWHDGLSELRANNKLMHKLNDEFKAVGSQTVTLSLNASIEASKSGEIGKGFKVVAQEISLLAQETQELCNNYSKELHKNDLLTTTAFQDTQAGSRMVLNAVDGLLYLASDLQREVSLILKSTKGNQIGTLLERLESLQQQITLPQEESK